MNNKIIALVVLIVLGLGGWWMWKAPASTEQVPEGGNSEQVSEELPAASGGTVPVTSKTPAKTTTSAQKGIKVVTYTNAGFSPFITEVKVGEAVRFVNNSSRAMWITGYQDPGGSVDTLYSELDQGKSIAKGQSYTFNFLKQGVWGYKNKNNEADRGAVAVQPN